jgi:hypothetical protein
MDNFDNISGVLSEAKSPRLKHLLSQDDKLSGMNLLDIDS